MKINNMKKNQSTVLLIPVLQSIKINLQYFHVYTEVSMGESFVVFAVSNQTVKVSPLILYMEIDNQEFTISV